jgi:hypothetical protein
MAHGKAREGKWRGNWRMEWVASTLHTTSQHGVSSITTADAHTPAASSRLNWRTPADLNGLVPFAERRNLVSAHVPSHFKRSLGTKGVKYRVRSGPPLDVIWGKVNPAHNVTDIFLWFKVLPLSIHVLIFQVVTYLHIMCEKLIRMLHDPPHILFFHTFILVLVIKLKVKINPFFLSHIHFPLLQKNQPESQSENN